MLKKLTALLLVALTCMTMLLIPSSSLAASATYKGAGVEHYYVRTGYRGSKLTLKPVKGTIAQDYYYMSAYRVDRTQKTSIYAKYKVRVHKAYAGYYDKTYIITNQSKTITLDGSDGYFIDIECMGPTGSYAKKLEYNGSFLKPKQYWHKYGNEYWYKDPSIKLSASGFGTYID